MVKSFKQFFEVPWRIRRTWLALIGGTCLLVLVGSLIGDLWLGTQTTANVYTPITALLGGAFLSYLWAKREDRKLDEGVPPVESGERTEVNVNVE